ncbi:hypothetical protein EJP02_478 [Escherichia phage EJP2]|nr:hypothetical protein EJP02_478 [Escherichia phage EJP2]
MKALTAVEIKEQYKDLFEFKHNGEEFKRSSTVRDFLNKLFCTKFKAAYITMPERTSSAEDIKKFGLGWDAQSIILVNADEELVYLTNSEWASFMYLRK